MNLKFVKEKCIGCHLCELACSTTRLDIFNPKEANLIITYQYQDDDLKVKAELCNLCGKCIKVCPEGAISLEANNYLILNKALCNGCGICKSACPQGVIFMKDNFPQICNMCKGKPQCVKSCLHQALILK
ncbi:MAG: 4Fe-4S binding protein [Armatimonadetes bacterium]|nr:4Fe-4S binding protein [Armatimonadota bacterium]